MFDVFSKRAQREAGKGSEAYKYDQLPEPLKVQVIHICNGVAGDFPAVSIHGSRGSDAFYSGVRTALCREHGLPGLTNRAQGATADVWEFFLQEQKVEMCLDVIEVVFACLVRAVQADSYVNFGMEDHIRQAAEEVNARFQEHAIGYEFREGRFIRIDSGFLHREVVGPAMNLLREPYLRGANQEFSKANYHFRHHRFGECINECLKAFESTMKAICDKRGWGCDPNATASALLDTCKRNGLFPSYMETSLAGLRSVLQNVATMRNKLSGHGQGSQPIQITEETAAFVLHSTAANILFLSALERQLR